MPNNSSEISNRDIVCPPEVLDQGLPLPGLDGRIEVQEGWVAILTEGGAFKEILGPGTHFLNKYHHWRTLRATHVNTRINRLQMRSSREFRISSPIKIEIDLDLTVEYRVSDPRRVALEFSDPLTSLWDRIHKAVGGVVTQCTHDELYTQGEGIARITLQRLQGMQLPVTMGIQVHDVFVTRLDPTDAGRDELAKWQSQTYIRAQEWLNEARMLADSQMSVQWLVLHAPDILKEWIRGNQAILQATIEHGGWDPADVLRRFATETHVAPPGMDLGLPEPKWTLSDPPPILVEPESRVREEIELLRKQPGAQVEARADLVGGTYAVNVKIPRPSGGTISLMFSCPSGFPSHPPLLDIELDGEPTSYTPSTLRRWDDRHYLNEIVNEVKQALH